MDMSPQAVQDTAIGVARYDPVRGAEDSVLYRYLHAVTPRHQATVSWWLGYADIRFELDLNTVCKLKAQSVGNTITIAEECERDLRPKRYRRG